MYGHNKGVRRVFSFWTEGFPSFSCLFAYYVANLAIDYWRKVSNFLQTLKRCLISIQRLGREPHPNLLSGRKLTWKRLCTSKSVIPCYPQSFDSIPRHLGLPIALWRFSRQTVVCGIWPSTTSEYISPTIQRQRRNARDRLDLTEGTQIYECEPIPFRPSGLMDADHTIATSCCNPGRLSPTLFRWFSVVPFRSFDSSIFQSRLIENIVQRKCRNDKNQIKRRRRNINFSQAPSKLIQ